MFSKTLVTLALATGFAAAKPINTPQSLPAYVEKRDQSFNNGFNGDFGNNFNFIDGFNRFNDQQQIIQIQEENLQIIDNGFQQQVVQQVNQVLIIDQQNNGFNRRMNDLFRRSNFRNNFNDQSTVVLVVQEIQVAVQDDFGRSFQQDLFLQSAFVANRGSFQTNTVMLFESQALIATQIINDNRGFGGFGGVGGVAGRTEAAVLPTKTQDVQLLGARPTWSSVVEDPAASLGGVWSAEIQDMQNADQDGADNQVNANAASQEAQALTTASAEASQSAEASATASAEASATSA